MSVEYGKKPDCTPLDEDLKNLRHSKFSQGAVDEIKVWAFQTILHEPVPSGSLLESLKDGIVLCRLANAINGADSPPDKPPLISYKQTSIPFMQMDQISQFLQFCRQYGVPEDELFQTVDLYEEKDPAIVYQTLKSLSRYANKRHPDLFPVLGPQLAERKPRPPVKNKPAHLKNGWSTQEYGFMGGASQKSEGIVFGKRRDVT